MSHSTMPQNSVSLQDASHQICPEKQLPSHILRLKEYLNENGIKLSVVASKAGFTPSWMTKVLNGQRHTADENFRKIEAILRIKLFDTKEEPTVLPKQNQN